MLIYKRNDYITKGFNMITVNDIKQLIIDCQIMGKWGLDNGTSADIPDLILDVLKPPCNFLGTPTNSAIFINHITYRQLSNKHPNWVLNKTIAIKPTLLKQSDLDIIGTIIHEVGHAFNVAASIPNTENNAYIFEIEVLLKLFKGENNLLNNCSIQNLKDYFQSRLPNYKLGITSNDYLAKLVYSLNQQFNLDPTLSCPLFKIKDSSFMCSPLSFFNPLKPQTSYDIVTTNLPSQVY